MNSSVKDVVSTLAAGATSVASFHIVTTVAYIERGYHGVGSELLIPLVAYWPAYLIAGKIIDRVKERQEELREQDEIRRNIYQGFLDRKERGSLTSEEETDLPFSA